MTVAILFDSSTESWSKIDIATPDPDAGEILVKVLGCTICGSDLHTVAGRRETPTPIILGHEIVGEIVKFGSGQPSNSIDGTPLVIGDRIVWSVVVNCGECFFCNHELPQKCLHGRKYGHVRFGSSRDLAGGFAEHMLLQRGTKCQKLPDSIPLEIACPVGCATATAVAAVEAFRVDSDVRVLVIGGGLVGLMTCAYLRYCGAKSVYCVEPEHSRRELAKQFGAHHAISKLDPQSLSEFQVELGFDAVIDCSGQNSAFDEAMKLVRVGGDLILVGAVFPSQPVPLVVERIVRRNLRLTGIHNYTPAQLVEAVRFTEAVSQDIKAHWIVDRWFELTDVALAIQHATSHKPLRVGVRTTFEH